MKVKFSSVPVGNKFEYNGQTYTRFTHNRGKQINNGRTTLINFPKHRIVTEK